jgi:hypothetical protein
MQSSIFIEVFDGGSMNAKPAERPCHEARLARPTASAATRPGRPKRVSAFRTTYGTAFRSLSWIALLVLVLISESPADAVLLGGQDGTTNTQSSSASATYSVGCLESASGTYLGGGWILTANHVGPGDFIFNDVTYQYIPGTSRRLETSPGELADLVMFQVYPAPPLASHPIRTTSPEIGDVVLMIGNGRDRGEETSFDPFGPEIEPDLQYGWTWASTQQVRWGFNEVEGFGYQSILGTTVFMTQFDDIDPILYESQAASGDSGGGVYTYDPQTGIELAGIMLSVSLEFGQSTSSSIFTNQTIIASLDVYADQINENMAVPEPSGGLLPGVGMLALWASNRRRARLSMT